MYKQACYVKTKGIDVINTLMSLGYVIQNTFDIDINSKEYLILTVPEFLEAKALILPINTNTKLLDDAFDCNDNEKAFLAIAGMRDDTDRHQYFVDEDGASWANLEMWIEPGSLIKCCIDEMIQCFNSPKTHRASAEEIFNYFEKNKDSKLYLA